MSDTLGELLVQQGAGAVLRAFGLDEVLSEADDAQLWACAVARHWPAPGDPEMDPAALRFGIGQVVPGPEGAEAQGTKSGMASLAVWCFQRAGAGRLQAVACQERHSMGLMGMLISGNAAAIGDPGVSLVRDYLDLSRPSSGQDRALVHAGTSLPVNAGRGETCYWARQADGRWVETGEVFARWLACRSSSS